MAAFLACVNLAWSTPYFWLLTRRFCDPFSQSKTTIWSSSLAVNRDLPSGLELSSVQSRVSFSESLSLSHLKCRLWVFAGTPPSPCPPSLWDLATHKRRTTDSSNFIVAIFRFNLSKANLGIACLPGCSFLGRMFCTFYRAKDLLWWLARKKGKIAHATFFYSGKYQDFDDFGLRVMT